MTERFEQIPESLRKVLKKLVHSETLAHLFVFVSPSIQAATCIAKDFVLEWLSSSSSFHPDLLEVKTTGKIGLHSIAGIRSVLDQLSLTPHAAKGRAVLIEASDKMLPPTANALLKALEEPPPRTLIVLTTDSPHRMLPTILSRAQIIRIPSEVALEKHVVQPLLDYIASENPTYSSLQTICDDIQKKIEAELSASAKKNLNEICKQYGDLTAAAKQEFQQEIEASSSQSFQTRSKEILEMVYLNTRAVEPFAKLETALYEVPVPKDGSISTNPIAKAIGEELSSHYLVPPRVGSVSSFAKGSVYQDEQAVSFLLEAMRGIDAGAELSHMLMWFVTNLVVQPEFFVFSH